MSAQPFPGRTKSRTVPGRATRPREHRGDGHIAALQAHSIGPTESLVSHAAVNAAPQEVFSSRQWTDEEWIGARERLTARGLVEADGRATDEGLRVRTAVEKLTDELASTPWDALTPGETARLAELLVPPVLDIVGSGLLPSQSTLGIGPEVRLRVSGHVRPGPIDCAKRRSP
ncbi:hypothetical protein [Streptomyces sp. NPDC051098]|uniref:SCO6745 family protein n=1 Tax=Streptomyces sp. NPDC051098 TaxID=3155411 RepID=UPI0034408A85